MHQLNIMVVEDEGLVSLYLQKVLKDLGYQIASSAFSGEEALVKARLKKPDLILMDYNLRGDLNGFETAQLIRQSQDIPIIFLTAYSSKDLIDEIIDSEPFGYLIKPVDERVLYNTIETAINRHRLETKLKEQEQLVRKLNEDLECQVRDRTYELKVTNLLLRVEQTLFENPNAPLAFSYYPILKLLDEVAGVSRAYIFINPNNVSSRSDNPGNLYVSQPVERVAMDGSVETANSELENITYTSLLALWQPILAAGKKINSPVADLPLSERVLLEQQGILSILVLPLIVNGELFGFIGFENCSQVRHWEAAEIALLRTVAAVLSKAQERLTSGAALRFTESRLQKSVATNRALLAAMPDALMRLDRDGNLINLQPAASDNSLGGAIWNTTDNVETIIGKNLSELFPQKLADQFKQHIKSVLASHNSVGFEYEIEIAGHYRDYEARCGVSYQDEVMVIVRDITERKSVERLKKEFVSTVSHELRTPLTSIRGALGLIQGGVVGPISNEAKSMLDVAYANTERLVRLISDILDIEKSEAGKMVFDMEPQSLMPLVEQAVKANWAYGEQYNIKFVIKPQEESELEVKAMVDSDRLTQVLANLLSNAAKFSPPGETVRIEIVQPNSSNIRVKIMDKGLGIPLEFHSQIFQKFAQADNSTTRNKSGSGLGLSIARAIVEAHGGQLHFESNGTTGTIFYFDLPVWPTIIDTEPGVYISTQVGKEFHPEINMSSSLLMQDSSLN